ncbi:MAG TPA: response regulator [Chitinispirillaceae bacterium]|nr:response regulator [Chitinispirillaceae bacterium]
MAKRNPKKILIVDDTQSISFVLEELLRDEGYNDIDVYDNANDALKNINEKKEKPDIIITDYSMPGMNGIELLEKVAPEKNNIKAIVMTADPHSIKSKQKYTIVEKAMGFLEEILRVIGLT